MKMDFYFYFLLVWEMRQLNNLSRREIENDNNNNILQFEKKTKTTRFYREKCLMLRLQWLVQNKGDSNAEKSSVFL